MRLRSGIDGVHTGIVRASSAPAPEGRFRPALAWAGVSPFRP
jgi:hypothetical protein